MVVSQKCVRIAWCLCVSVFLLVGCPNQPSGTVSDTDGDGLTDIDEETKYFTDPLLADTDGDGLTDKDEIDDPGFSPLMAEIPIIKAWISKDPTLTLNKETGMYDESTSLQASLSSHATQTAQQHEESTEHSVTHSEEISASLEYGAGGASGSVEATASYEESTTNMSSSSWSSESTRKSQQEAQKTSTESVNQEFSEGTITTGFTVKNIGKRSVRLNNFSINVDLKEVGNPDATKTAVTSIGPTQDEDLESITLSVGNDNTYNVENQQVNADLVLQVMQDPRKLSFEIGSYNLEDPTGNDINYTEVAEHVAARTSVLTFDYGDGTVDVFLVATGVKRDDNNNPVGMKIKEIFELITSASNDSPDSISFTTKTIDETGKTILQSITRDGVEYANELKDSGALTGTYEARWYYTSSASNATTLTDFNDLLLKPKNRSHFVYIKNSDDDKLIDRAEARYGTDINEPDTDGDGISDYQEVIEGDDGIITDPLDPTNSSSSVFQTTITLYEAGSNGTYDLSGTVSEINNQDFSALEFGNGHTVDNAIGSLKVTDAVGVLLFEQPDQAPGCILYLEESGPNVSRRIGFKTGHDPWYWTVNPGSNEPLSNVDFSGITSSIKVFPPESITTDTDGDGLPDQVEQYLTDTVFNDASPAHAFNISDDDYDSDGLLDWFELLYNFDPRNPRTNNISLDTAANTSMDQGRQRSDLWDVAGFLSEAFPDGVYLFSGTNYTGVFEGYNNITDTCMSDDNAIGAESVDSIYIINPDHNRVALYHEEDYAGGTVGDSSYYTMSDLSTFRIKQNVADLGSDRSKASSLKVDYY